MTDFSIDSHPAVGERIAGGRVKGSMIRAHLDWVRDHGSREETIELFAALPQAVRAQVSTVLAASWYDFSVLMEVDRAILALFGRGELRFLEKLGAWWARANLADIRFFDLNEVHDFLRREARRDFGTAEYRQDGSAAGVMTHRDSPSYSPLYCAGAIGYYRECLLLHGAERASVIERTCQCAGDEACIFDLAWS